jgi:hypothetical protein
MFSASCWTFDVWNIKTCSHRHGGSITFILRLFRFRTQGNERSSLRFPVKILFLQLPVIQWKKKRGCNRHFAPRGRAMNMLRFRRHFLNHAVRGSGQRALRSTACLSRTKTELNLLVRIIARCGICLSVSFGVRWKAVILWIGT